MSKIKFTSYGNVNIFQYKNPSPMNWPDNFVNQKMCNLVDETDFNKNIYLHTKGHSLTKTAFIFIKLCLLFKEKNI